MIAFLKRFQVFFSQGHHLLQVLEVYVLLDLFDFFFDSIFIERVDARNFRSIILDFSHFVLRELVLRCSIFERPEMLFEAVAVFAFANQFGHVAEHQVRILVIHINHLHILVILLRVVLLDLIIIQLIIVAD
jgi:hypothetical protein